MSENPINLEPIDLFGVRTEIAACGSGDVEFLFLHPERGLRGADAFLRALGAHGRVIAPYHPGYKFDAPNHFKSVDDLSYFYLDLMASLDLRRVTIVGSSLGGWLAMEIASKDTTRIASLCLLSPAGVKMAGRSERDMQDIFSLEERAVESLSFLNPAMAGGAPDSGGDAELELAVRAREASARYAWLPYMHNPALARRLHRIDIPALVLSGEDDRIVSPNVGRALAKRLPRGVFSTLGDCGHYPHIECAEATARHVIDWHERHADAAMNAMKGVA
ncbi:alpha/beta hydrolase [Pseudorhodoplanes sp.]|uniref:alpha/beta fold hydrolase n=1 Tax=Pseudorhodoplanes sp. TaxID=1934341 RepID=UPI002CFC0DE4|nr:alpha/beta hydrolase [Pseudorhodoplanes sp.]HWV40683.1 alpha/beta hydrolase [Pseudorhodoplanes sp.]